MVAMHNCSELRRQGLNRGAAMTTQHNTMARRGKKDHENHVPSSEALTWVQYHSTLLCHIKRPRHGPVHSSITYFGKQYGLTLQNKPVTIALLAHHFDLNHSACVA